MRQMPYQRRPKGQRPDGVLTAVVLAALAANAPAQQQFASLRGVGIPERRNATDAVACGDVDGDGDLDIVYGDVALGLLRNDGDGVFADVTSGRIAPGTSCDSLALGDVDGDGDLDIVVGSGGPDRVLLNDGTGGFLGPNATLSTSGSRALALADLDGDGDLDLVAAIPGRTALHVNDGSGNFTDLTAARLPAITSDASSIAVGDIDGDADPDIVIGNHGRFPGGPEQNDLYLNDGDGFFSLATGGGLPVRADHTRAVVLADVDLDGDLDLVTGNEGRGEQNRLALNDGAGVFTDATAWLPVQADATTSVMLGDLDGDGDPDMVVGNLSYGGSTNRLLLNDGSGTFGAAGPGRLDDVAVDTQAIGLGDVDGDGDLDVVFGNDRPFGAEQDRLYLNDGAANFVDATATPGPTARGSVAVLGDVDGDGDPDAFIGGAPDSLFVNDGTGSYADASAQLPANTAPTRDAVLSDVDRDGDLDLVAARLGAPNALWFNDGSGRFTDVTATRMPAISRDTRAVAVGDVDGDGDHDLVFGDGRDTYYTTHPTALGLNDGSGRFSAGPERMPGIANDTYALRLGDVDGDGDLDVVVGNGFADNYYTLPQPNRLYLNLGQGVFADVSASHLPPGADVTRDLDLGDVDCDGDLDILLANSPSNVTSGRNRLLLNDGNGVFADAGSRLPANAGFTTAAALVDADGDGDLDAFVDGLFLNDGTGTFTAASGRLPAPLEHAAAAADVDGDGDLDVLTFDRSFNAALLFNLQRHLATPRLLRPGRRFDLDLYARFGPAGAPDLAVGLLSLGRAQIPFAPYGVLGLDPLSLVALPPVVIPQPAGVVTVSFRMPGGPSVIGTALYAQALVVPFPFQGRLSNVVGDVVVQ